MSKLKRCPCCNSENVGPDFDFPTEEGDSGITIRCGSCGLMLTPSLWPSDDDGDCLSQDSDEVQDVLNELSALWNTRLETVASRDVLRFGSRIISEIEKYANKVNAVDTIQHVNGLKNAMTVLEEKIKEQEKAV